MEVLKTLFDVVIKSGEKFYWIPSGVSMKDLALREEGDRLFVEYEKGSMTLRNRPSDICSHYLGIYMKYSSSLLLLNETPVTKVLMMVCKHEDSYVKIPTNFLTWRLPDVFLGGNMLFMCTETGNFYAHSYPSNTYIEVDDKQYPVARIRDNKKILRWCKLVRDSAADVLLMLENEAPVFCNKVVV